MATLNLEAAKSLVKANAEISDAAKETISNQLDEAAAIPDTWVYRVVVLALGLAIFTPLIAVLWGKSDETMKLLLPIGTGALGALAGLLVPAAKG
jgi:type VI protein secretion system component VasF